MLDTLYKELEKKMSASLDRLKQEYSRLRTGRATPTLLDGVKVEHYGTLSPIKNLANISIPEPRMIVIQPWDTSAITAIEKGIVKADLGLNPQNDGKVIRVQIPELTEERRKDLVKLIKKIAEDTRVSIRQHRRTANEELKKLEKDKEITEDELKKGQDKVQELTDKFIKDIDKVAEQKEKEVMED